MLTKKKVSLLTLVFFARWTDLTKVRVKVTRVTYLLLKESSISSCLYANIQLVKKGHLLWKLPSTGHSLVNSLND